LFDAIVCQSVRSVNRDMALLAFPKALPRTLLSKRAHMQLLTLLDTQSIAISCTNVFLFLTILPTTTKGCKKPHYGSTRSRNQTHPGLLVEPLQTVRRTCTIRLAVPCGYRALSDLGALSNERNCSSNCAFKAADSK